MKRSPNGFIVPLLLVIIAVLVIVGGAYIYSHNQKRAVNEDASLNATTTAQIDSSSQQSNSGATATLDLSTSFARLYKTRLTEALAQPANFNEHYVIATIGCGTGCFTYVAIDKNNGKPYPAPMANDLGQFNGDLEFVQPTLHSNILRVVVENGSKINNYGFNGNNFDLISTDRTPPLEGLKRISENGFTIDIPDSFSFNTQLATVMQGTATVLNVTNYDNSNTVIQLFKYKGQLEFNEDNPSQGAGINYTLVNANYDLNGNMGKYYTNANGGEDKIIFPSKLVTILLSSASFSGMSSYNRDQMVASINF